MLGVAVFFALALAISAETTYHGHKVYKVTPANEWHLEWLRKFPLNNLEVDFWKDPIMKDYPVDIQVAPHHEKLLTKSLSSVGIPHEKVIDNLQILIDAEKIANKPKNESPFYEWDYYMPFDEIENFLDAEQDICDGSNYVQCIRHNIGDSWEGRPLHVVEIRASGDGGPKQALWVDGGIHAREWIAHHVTLYFMQRLINDYDVDEGVRLILDNYDVFIEPVLNPDGYVFSHTDDRMWRKSRRPNEGSACLGTDVNRNFDYQWNTIGTSPNPCSATYAGSNAYSEPEAEAVANFIESLIENGREFVSFMTVHSYGQLWMAPFGYSCDHIPDFYEEMLQAGTAGVDALRAVNGISFQLGRACDILYFSSGTSRDWAKGVPEIKYVYTLELRPTSSNPGFVLPPAEIDPSCKETWAGYKAMVAEIIAIESSKK